MFDLQIGQPRQSLNLEIIQNVPNLVFCLATAFPVCIVTDPDQLGISGVGKIRDIDQPS